ncbi:MAG: restriction endonuclease [Actinobacteria bacterium]|nr:restriction endonuclease [Actinomycetota bacterium]
MTYLGHRDFSDTLGAGLEEGSIVRIWEPQKQQVVKVLVNDFVFADCALDRHPRVLVRVYLTTAERAFAIYASTEFDRYGNVVITGDSPLVRRLAEGEWVMRGTDEITSPRISIPSRYRHFVAVPIGKARVFLGMVVFLSPDEGFFRPEHVASGKLLAALIRYVLLPSWVSNRVSRELGELLQSARESLRLTQTDLAANVGVSRICLSRWEAGSQPPSMGPLFRWCRSLGILTSSRGAIVSLVDVTPSLLKMLKEDPSRLHQLSPSVFEKFIAERIDRMGFDVQLTGALSLRDGGIDLIAVPKLRTAASFLLAGQVKHHQDIRKTGRSAVDRLLAWRDSQFRLGLLVTNTDFTKDARWVAAQENNRAFLRLRDFADLKRWLEDNFTSEEDWREIPDTIVLAPGITIAIPRPSTIWHRGI